MTTSTKKAAHTPGPWTFTRTDKQFRLSDPDGSVLRINGGMIPREADARLIAKAPEMLEVLEAIVASAKNGNEPGQTWITIAGGLLEPAEAVLRSVRGEK